MYDKVFKRVIDIIFSIIGLIIFCLPMIIIFVLIKSEDAGPVFFFQRRVGINDKYFNICKIRSMKMNTPKDKPTHLLENPEQYLLPIGAFMRKYSIDEIPQLINILKGDMSFVGPRPALWNQYDLIEERHKYGVEKVKPGLTGWAQVNGRDELDVLTKAKYDGEYVNKESFLFDIKCVVLTIKKVFTADGVVEGKHE